MELILQMVGIGFSILFLVMCVLWVIELKTGNAAIVDAGWGNGFAVLAIVYFFMGDGSFDRRLFMAAMVVFWGLRLSAYLLVDRILAKKPEDGRYVEIRRRWKTNIHLKFFFFFQFQTVLVTVLSFPFLLMSLNPEPGLSWLEWTGFAVWATGLIGESIADRQLKRFKDDPANAGKVCQEGLWKYSRHPNYFFEWVVWIGYFLAALSSPYGWISILSPLAMLYILTQVTGIRMTEEQSIRSRGDAYREYQRTTSAFVPWFRSV